MTRRSSVPARVEVASVELCAHRVRNRRHPTSKRKRAAPPAPARPPCPASAAMLDRGARRRSPTRARARRSATISRTRPPALVPPTRCRFPRTSPDSGPGRPQASAPLHPRAQQGPEQPLVGMFAAPQAVARGLAGRGWECGSGGSLVVCSRSHRRPRSSLASEAAPIP